VKRAALDSARAQLARLQAQPRPEELPPLEAKVREATALLRDAEVQVQLIESVSDNRAVKKEDVLRRRQSYEAANARLAQAEKDLALTKAGAWAPDETDVWRVQAGDPAIARVRGNSQIAYPLDFVRFEPSVIPKKSLTGDSTERVDTRVLEVIYALRADARVYDGQQLDVFITNRTVAQPGGGR